MPASDSRWSGDSTCGFCLQLYVVELERHCGGCDEPICPLCVVAAAEQGRVLCPGCASRPWSAEEED
jgi:hypothetical protein